MDILYVRLGFGLFGLVFVLWGGAITFSNRYYEYWRSKYWGEDRDLGWLGKSRNVNRWGTCFGGFVFGLAVLYFVIFQMG